MGVEGDHGAVGQGHGSGHLPGAAAQGAGRGAQGALGVGESEGGGGSRHRGEAEVLRLGEVGGEHRERSPRGGKAGIGVEAAAEQFGVVADDEQRSDHQERDQPGSDLTESVDPDS